jgi:group I intron endonuclease
VTGELYLATSPSGKRYVGITLQGVQARWREHVKLARLGRRSRLSSAIRKYGEDSFKVEVIGTGTWEELNRMEPDTIARLGTLWPKGYNLRTGGNQPRHHQETRLRISSTMSGKRKSPEHRERIRASLQALTRTPEGRDLMKQRSSLRRRP